MREVNRIKNAEDEDEDGSSPEDGDTEYRGMRHADHESV